MATDTLQLLGKTIADKYAVESVVGEGGFATVYRATHLIWKRPVALKVFKALGDFGEKDRVKLLEEFVQEGALLADLSARSAAIVQARDIGTLTGPAGEVIPYMVLEWLEGATLEAVLADEKTRGVPLRTMAQALQLLEPAAEALALAHRKGIAHRDVKPGNVFVLGDPRGDCTVKLLDFGIAKVVNDMQKMAGTFTKTSGQITSFTPAYGAPEQFSRTHGATGPWTDVFALALILGEVCSGQEPLEGDDFVQLAVCSGSTERRPTPRTLGAPVTDAVEAVIAKALSVRPADRWQSAGEFWNALRNALQMTPIRAATDPAPPGSYKQVSSAVMDPGVGMAPTVAATTDPQPPVAVATLPNTGGTGRAGLWAAVVAGALLVGGGGLFFFERHKAGSEGATVGASQSTSVASNIAAPPPPAQLCPKGMVKIPAGDFFMGSDDDLPMEKPSHQVHLTVPYCMDKFEVTVEDYKACTDAGQCERAFSTNDIEGIPAKDHKVYDSLCTIRDPGTKAKHPINCVTWDMANKYCLEHDERLPTEAEWEFAARGKDGRKYPWGDDEPGPEHTNACGTECVLWGQKNGITLPGPLYDADDGFPNTAPVGSFPKGASLRGVNDVVGNVAEWVADRFAEYTKDEQTNPEGPSTGEWRVVRGGAWNGAYAAWVRPTFRYKARQNARSHGIGFRCAK